MNIEELLQAAASLDELANAISQSEQPAETSRAAYYRALYESSASCEARGLDLDALMQSFDEQHPEIMAKARKANLQAHPALVVAIARLTAAH